MSLWRGTKFAYMKNLTGLFGITFRTHAAREFHVCLDDFVWPDTAEDNPYALERYGVRYGKPYMAGCYRATKCIRFGATLDISVPSGRGAEWSDVLLAMDKATTEWPDLVSEFPDAPRLLADSFRMATQAGGRYSPCAAESNGA